LPLSKIIKEEPRFKYVSNSFFFLLLVFGKNPKKLNVSVGKPDTVNAAITEEGPGTLKTSKPSSIVVFTSL